MITVIPIYGLCSLQPSNMSYPTEYIDSNFFFHAFSIPETYFTFARPNPIPDSAHVLPYSLRNINSLGQTMHSFENSVEARSQWVASFSANFFYLYLYRVTYLHRLLGEKAFFCRPDTLTVIQNRNRLISLSPHYNSKTFLQCR